MLVSAGLLNKSELGDLVSYNYTDQCTYERHWTDITIAARGTIYNKVTGEVVARAFDKFFNLNEHESTKIENLPKLPFSVSVKEDGSLGILFEYEGGWRVATRGSFRSDQAEWATKKLNSGEFFMNLWPAEWTPLVEIIYAENKIIVDYMGFEGLILIGARHKHTGKHMSHKNLMACANAVGFRTRHGVVADVDELVVRAKTLDGNEEGWVITYESDLMVKIKGARYIEIARFASHLNPQNIWEKMMKGDPVAFITGLPDELHVQANEMHKRLRDDWLWLETQAQIIGSDIGVPFEQTVEDWDRKDKLALIERIKLQPKWCHSYLFGAMRGVRHEGVRDLLRRLEPFAGKFVEVATICGVAREHV